MAVLFSYSLEERYSLEAKMYTLAKRMRQPYSEIMNMPRDVRDKFFKLELEEIEREKQK